MSYYNELANQASGFANYNQVESQRGEDRINDYNIERGEYTGAEVAHRSGLQALKTGNEMPRLMEEYFGLKPAAQKIVPALLEKSGATDAFKSAIKGTKLEGYFNRAKTATENVRAAAKAVKDGDYGKAADVMTGGKASEAAASVKKFAQDTLEHHTEIAKDAVNKGIGEAKNTIDGFVGNVRRLGSDTYSKLSAEAKAALPKGSIDEDGIPLNPNELSRSDTYKGLTTGRMKANDDGTITDTLNDSIRRSGVGGEGLPGGGRLTIDKSGQMSFKTEGGDPYGVGGSSDDLRVGSQAYEAQKEASLGRDFQGTAETQATLERMTAEKEAERGSVDFSRPQRQVDPAQLSERARGKRAIKEPDAAPRASAEDVAQARIPKFQARANQNVRIRGDPSTDAGEGAQAQGGAQDSGVVARIQQKIRDNQAAKEPTIEGDTAESLARESAARSTTTEGGYLDSTAPMRMGQAQAEAQARQTRTAQQAAESDAGKSGEEAGSFIERAGASIAKDVSPISGDITGIEGAVAKARLTDSGRSQISKESRVLKTETTQESDIYQPKFTSSAPAAGSEKEIVEKGAEGLGKTVAETEGELAPVEEAESAVPEIGPILMGLTAIGGLVRGAIKEHQEKKSMDADAPVAPTAPTAPQAAGAPQSGVGFNVAPVIDSDDFHHL